MDIVEYVEKVAGVELYQWQKEYLRALSKLPEGKIRLIIPRKSGLHIYLDKQILKELTQNGETLNSSI